MNREEAEKILADCIKSDGTLYNLGAYLSWSLSYEEATLDGEFSADQLEAIAWWMRNMPGEPGSDAEPDPRWDEDEYLDDPRRGQATGINRENRGRS